MARVRIWGAEMGDLSDCQTTSGTISIVSSPVVSGGHALRANPTTTGTGYAFINGFKTTGALDAGNSITNATRWHKFKFRYATKPGSGAEDICAVVGNAATLKGSVRLTSTGTLDLYDSGGTKRGTGSTVLSADTWYRIEVKYGTDSGSGIDDSAYELKINGTSEYSGSNANGLITQCGGLCLGKYANNSSQSVDFFYDDCVIDDAAYPGDSAIAAMQPDGAGTYSGASVGTYADVDELPHDGDTTFLGWTSNVNRHSASLESSASAGISGTINCVQPYGIGRDLGTGRAVAVFMRTGTTDTDSGTGYDFGTAYEFFGGKNFATDPQDSAAWTTTKLDSMEIGAYVNDSSSGTQIRVTAFGAMVEYVAAGGGGVVIPVFVHHYRLQGIC